MLLDSYCRPQNEYGIRIFSILQTKKRKFSRSQLNIKGLQGNATEYRNIFTIKQGIYCFNRNQHPQFRQTCGLANQVIDLKVDNLVNKSPRSHGRQGDDWADANKLPDIPSSLPGNFLPNEDERRRFRPLSFWTPFPL